LIKRGIEIRNSWCYFCCLLIVVKIFLSEKSLLVKAEKNNFESHGNFYRTNQKIWRRNERKQKLNI
jgi:hypothetical protein